MVSSKKNILAVVLFSIIVTGLFHKQALGLNLLISEVIFMLWLFFSKQFAFKGSYSIALSLGVMLTSIATVLTHSTFSYILHFIVLFIFIGLLIYPNTKSLVNTIRLSFTNIFNSQILFLRALSNSKLKGRKPSGYIRKASIFILPIIIIIVFTVIYRKSNPIFDNLVGSIVLFIQQKLSFSFDFLDLSAIFTFIVCLFISIFMFIRSSNERLIELDKNATTELIRKPNKNRQSFRTNALKNEYKSGVFLLVALNLILFILNVIDVKWVWFGFEWEGQYLKQFVHEGTYLLILSILISIFLVLYYFRANLNFYKDNKLLRTLSYIWLVQNAILAISVGMRNYWYIDYFSLAYKRIGVIIFLILTIYGLYSVYVKVKQRKSNFYLVKVNLNAFLLVLVISSLFNWDIIIAKYNFSHFDRSFLHLDYMSTLSNKSLPYLDKSLHELKQINLIQKDKFPFDQEYMPPEEYYDIITKRKEIFIKKWESKSILSWNFPEYRAYKKLLE